jgi:exodeoxyribonuclease VII large subunit
LERGFALVRGADGQAIRSVGGVQPGNAIEIEFADGCLDASVRGVKGSDGKPVAKPRPSSIVDPAQVRSPRGKGGSTNGGQGSLF